MRSLYVVTHPEATHHVERVVGGWHDSELTPTGARAAESIATALRDRIPDGADVELYTSDLKRTHQTAVVVGDRLGVEAIPDPRLREKSYGEAEGRPQEWLDERFVPPPAVGERLEHDEGVPGGETKGACARRVYAAMAEILASDCAHQIVVTHGMAMSYVITSWIAMPLESLAYVSFRAPAGSITELREDDYFHNRQVVRLGDTGHLAP